MNTRKAKTLLMFKEMYYVAWDCIEGKMRSWYALDVLEHYLNQAICFAPWLLRRRLKRFQAWFTRNRETPSFDVSIFRVESALYGLLRGMGVEKTFFVNHRDHLPHGFAKKIPLSTVPAKVSKRDENLANGLKALRESDDVEDAISSLDQITA